MTKTALSRRAPWLAALAFITFGAPTQAAVFCVNSAGTLQTALSTAASNGVDDEIRIVQGTYVGNFVYTSTQANKLSVLGGYATGCGSRTLNPANTVLDGNQVNTVLALSAPNVAAEFLLEGLTLRNGKRTSGTGNGGGLYALTGNTGTVTARRNRVKNNTANSGGGVSANARAVTLTNNSFSGNTGTNGGGAYVGGDHITSTVMLANNSFSDNSGFGGGGGGAFVFSNTVTLTNNSFSGNRGGGYYGGGGAYVSSGHGTGPITLTNNRFSDNTSDSNGGGAAFTSDYCSTRTITLTNNSFSGNRSNSGGGAYVGLCYDGTITLTNNSFSDNTGSDGGGARISGRTITLTNNSIVGNQSKAGAGLNLYIGSAETTDSATLYNNLFWNNVATDNQGADLKIENDSDGDHLPTPIKLFGNSFNRSTAGFQITVPITIHSSNIKGLAPLFVDAAKGDLHLLPGSPMINAGYAQTPNLPETDFEGDPRVLGGRVDIGADEFDDGSDDAPDFRVTKLALTPGSPKVKGTFSVAVTVRNQGTASGDAGYLDVWTNQPTAVTCGADGNAWAGIGRLEPGKSRTLTLTGLRGGAAGRKTLRAVVDSWCETREVNDANNQTVKAYSVVP